MLTKTLTARHLVEYHSKALNFTKKHSTEVYNALKNIRYPHIYPDPESRRLRACLVSMHSLNSGMTHFQSFRRQLNVEFQKKICWSDVEQMRYDLLITHTFDFQRILIVFSS